jgi:hypothetical protein
MHAGAASIFVWPVLVHPGTSIPASLALFLAIASLGEYYWRSGVVHVDFSVETMWTYY